MVALVAALALSACSTRRGRPGADAGDEASQAGVRLSLMGDNLRVEAPRGAATAELRARPCAWSPGYPTGSISSGGVESVRLHPSAKPSRRGRARR